MVLDNRILVSLHGKRLGLSRGAHLVEDDHVIVPSWRDPGSRVNFIDHFLGSTLDGNKWGVFAGSDGSAVAPAITVAKGGIVRGVTGAGAGATMAVNGTQINGALNWQPDQGSLTMSGAVKMSAITTIATFIGFTNQSSALGMPGTISGGTLTGNRNDFCGFLFDTAATAATWKFVNSIGGVVGTILDTGAVPVTTLFDVVRIEIDVLGNITATLISQSGTEYVVQVALGITPTVPLCPVVAGFRRSAASANIDTDFLQVGVDRTL